MIVRIFKWRLLKSNVNQSHLAILAVVFAIVFLGESIWLYVTHHWPFYAAMIVVAALLLAITSRRLQKRLRTAGRGI